MSSSILSIGQSALNAAQIGLDTTGHNIANAKTPGYSRQVVVQQAAAAQNYGFGYLGQGTSVAAVNRVYNEISAKQLINSQSTSSQLTTYSTQMNQIDDMLSDPTAGLSPAMQDFFSSMQALSTNPSDTASKQSVLSNSQSLASRFHSLDSRLGEIRESINSQLTSSVSLVNSYAQHIAKLNDSIIIGQSLNGNPPNDLMDQRDQIVAELSKQIKTTIVKQDGTNYNVFIGNGLPLVVSNNSYSITTLNSPTDSGRLEIGYVNSGKVSMLGVDSLPGGNIGGLVQFRSESLDNIQNQLGQIAIAFADSFNQQHRQALDSTGSPGGNFFTIPAPETTPNVNNIGNAVVSASMTDVSALTASNYRLQYDGSQYIVTRLTDGVAQSFSSLPQKVDGLQFSLTSGSMTNGDNFLIRPTFNGATGITVGITNTSKLALGAPAVSAAKSSTNTGTGTVSTAIAESGYTAAGLPSAITFSFSGGNLTSSPATNPVTVTVGSTQTTYPAGTPVPYTNGAKITVAGVSFTVSGTPSNGDQFSVNANSGTAPGNNSNALLLNALRTKPTMNGASTSYEGAFSQLISGVGNKTHELSVTSAAEEQTLTSATEQQQSESGVNLDEEATNLLRYQQAYQAAGKMMQIATQLFDVLLSLGR